VRIVTGVGRSRWSSRCRIPTVEPQVGVPQVQVNLIRREAAAVGLRGEDLAETVETAFGGHVVSQVLEEQRRYDDVVRMHADARRSIETLARTLIDTPSGARVPLAQVAEVRVDAGPNTINRENVQRRIIIQANVAGRDLGGVVMVFLAGGTLSIASLIGFITLFGIATRNGIMLISHYRHLMEEEGVAFDDAIVQGSLERLSPILMTALVTGIGLIPLAVGAGEPGKEIQHPMAIVILGGIVSSTVLNMLVIPALYLRYGRSTAQARSRLETLDGAR
jgi:Cu/Ag efflux pump CusA